MTSSNERNARVHHVARPIRILIYPIGIPLMYWIMVWQHHEILSDADAVTEEIRNGMPNISHVLFLVETYEEQYYWFESLECIRRLLLAAIIGVVSEDAAAAPVMGIFISAAFTYVFAGWRPYKEDSDDTFSIVLAYSLLFFFVAALMIKAQVTTDDEDDQKVFGILLIFMLASGPIAVMILGTTDVYTLISSRFASSTTKSEVVDEESNRDVTEPPTPLRSLGGTRSARSNSLDKIPQFEATSSERARKVTPGSRLH